MRARTVISAEGLPGSVTAVRGAELGIRTEKNASDWSFVMAKNVSIAEILASRSIPTGEGSRPGSARPQNRRPEAEPETARREAKAPAETEEKPLSDEKTIQEKPRREQKEQEAYGSTKVFERVNVPEEETAEEPKQEAEEKVSEEGREIPLQELLKASGKETGREEAPQEAEPVKEEPEEEPWKEEPAGEMPAAEPEEEPAADLPEEVSGEEPEEPAKEAPAKEEEEPEDSEEKIRIPAFSSLFEEITIDPEEESPAEIPAEAPSFEEVFEEYDLDSVRSDREKKDFMLRIPKMQTPDVDLISQNLSGKLEDSLEEDLRTPTRPETPVNPPAPAQPEEEEKPMVSLRERSKQDAARRAGRKSAKRRSFAERDREDSLAEKRRSAGRRRAEEEEGAEEGKKMPGGLIRELIIIAAVFLFCLVIIPNFIVQRTIVNGDSMNETLHNGDQLMVDKLTPHFKDFERFDVVVFYPFGKDQSDEYYIKRIIGLPGETVQITGDTIYINGEVLEEDYGKDPMTYAGIAAEPLTLGEDEYFLLGDHREISFDSRYEQVGVVSRKQIAGKAVVRIWPLKDLGSFD